MTQQDAKLIDRVRKKKFVDRFYRALIYHEHFMNVRIRIECAHLCAIC